jgi:hypothetical protein
VIGKTMLRYGDDGCLADDGPLVTYVDYRELEIADDIFQKKVHQVLKDLTALPELSGDAARRGPALDLDDGVTDAIVALEKAFSERTD